MDIALNLERAERDFVEALTRQERWAQQQVYEEHYGRMMGICLRYAGSRDEALDLLHDGAARASTVGQVSVRRGTNGE